MENKTELTFEESLKRLEEIVSELEKGDVSLEESMDLFEEGTKHVAYCNNQLENAEQKVMLLKKGTDGAPEMVPFEEAKDED